MQKLIAAMEGHHKSDNSAIVANLPHNRHLVPHKVDGVSRHFLVDSGVDMTVIEHSFTRLLQLLFNLKTHITCSIGHKLVNIIGSATAHFSIESPEWWKLFS